jgi:hypothetical protein
MIPSIYIAGASKELARSRHWIEELSKIGFRITHDWTEAVAKYGSCGAELSAAERGFHARSDLRGIDEAHVVWLLAPPPEATSIGMWIEFGYALNTRNKTKIVVSPPISDRCIFANLVQVIEFPNDEEAFAYIQEYRA